MLLLAGNAHAAAIGVFPVTGAGLWVPFVPAGLGAPSDTPNLSGSLTPGLAPSLMATPGISAAPSLSAPALAIEAGLTPSLLPSAEALPADQAPVSAMDFLKAEIPFQAPEASDLQGQKDYGQRAFEYKMGSVGIEAAGDVSVEAAKKPAKPKPKPEEPENPGDDGGGPDYPRRKVAFNGETFQTPAFRPNVPVEEDLIKAIDATKKELHIASYEWKLRGLTEALRRARDRGVKIHIILDFEQVFPSPKDPAEKKPGDDDWEPTRSGEIWNLLREEFKVYTLRGLSKYGINHNKFMVFDGKMAEFGSYNYSFTAEKAHYENANFTAEKARIKDFLAYYKYLHDLSKPVHYKSAVEDYTWPASVPPPPKPTVPDVVFNGVTLPGTIHSPSGLLEDSVAAALGAAKKSVDISMFALLSTKIAEAVAAAKARGLKVRVIIDESQSESDAFGVYTKYLASQDIEVRTLGGPDPESEYPRTQKDHNKLMILDGQLVETGSANHTKYASKANFENAHFLDDATDAAAYTFFFDHMWSKAKPFAKPEGAVALPTEAELEAELEKQPGPRNPRPPVDPTGMPKSRDIPFWKKIFPSFIFRPYAPVESRLVEAIDLSQKTIHLALYEFRLEDVLEALRRAKKRGVEISVVLDQGHLYTTGKDVRSKKPKKPSEQIQALVKEFDVLVLKGQKSGIMHNKFAIFDGKMIEYGSYNWARTAEDNHFENAMFSNEKRRVSWYNKYFAYMREHAKEVDHDRLEEVMTRTEDSEPSARSAPLEDAAPEHDNKFPSPPEDPETPITVNGESYPNQLFSPEGLIEETLIRAIDSAKVSVEVAMFSFYSQKIADALLAAREKNPELKIRLALDLSQSRLAKLDDFFAFHGFDIVIVAGPNRQGDPMYEKMHNKFMIVDGKLLVTGSFNYSPNAETNSFENVNFINDPFDVAGYVWFFQQVYQHGFKPKAPKKLPPRPKNDPASAEEVS